MGRIAKQPVPVWDEKLTQWRLRFTHERVRFDYRSTTIAKSDRRGAIAWANERIRYVLSGEWKTQIVEGSDPKANLHEVAALYLASNSGGAITKRTADLRKIQLRAHLIPAFPTLASITKASLAEYQAERLKKVQYATIKKELSCLMQVLKYAEVRGLIAEIPPLPKRPAKSLGTKHRAAPSGHTPGFTEEHARAVIAHLPVLSRLHRDTGRHWPCRAYFEFLLETGLRPGTVHGLRVGTHWSPGAQEINITPDIDKNRFGRTVPLTPRAVELLTAAALDASPKGQMFHPRDHREALRKAAKDAGLPPEMVASVHQYDFRHARGTRLANTGQILGTSFLLGHKQMTTTNRYSHANQKQAAELVGLVASVPPGSNSGADSGANSGANAKKGPGGDCSPAPEPLFFSCAKERTRTSTGVTPLAPQDTPVGSESPISRGSQRTEAQLGAPKRKNSGAPPQYFGAAPVARLPRILLATVAHKLGILDQPCGVSL